jgi:hypothetical protein
MKPREPIISQPRVKSVEIVLPNKSIVCGSFAIWNEDPSNQTLGRVELRLSNRVLSKSNVSFFHALRDIRLELEKENILLKCFGSSRHVWPSGMGFSASKGEMAYKHYLGKKGDVKDVISIFDSGSDIDPCTFEEQMQFHKQWQLSIGISPSNKSIPWKALFAQQPAKALRLFLKENFARKQNRNN